MATNRTALARLAAGRTFPALCVVSLLALAGAAGPAAAQYMPGQTPAPPPFFALQNARIVTGAGSVIDSGTVVIGNGLIEAVGVGVDVPGDAWIIDAAGLTVYPGLFDALSSVGMGTQGGGENGGGGNVQFSLQGGQPRSVGAEDRPATNSWISAADMLDPESGSIERWRAGGFTSAMVAPDDGIVTGQGAVVSLAGDAREMVVKAPAALRVTMSGAGGFRSYPGSLMGVIAYIRQLYMDANHASAYEERYMADPRGRRRPAYDRALGPVQAAIAGGWPTLLPADEAREIRRAIKIARDTGMRLVVAGAQDAYSMADEIAAAGVSVLVDVDWPEENRDADPDADEPLSSLERRAYAPTTPARLEEAGADWAFYSGSVSSPGAVIDNVRTAIEKGLSEEAALGALTSAPARIYGLDAVMGSVEPGKIANLVVTDGPLFDEDTNVKMVFVDGRKFEEMESEEERPAEAPSVDISGTWILSVNNDSQEAIAELEVSEDGEVTGEIRSEQGNLVITSGWISGNEFNLTGTVEAGPGEEFEITISGTAEENSLEGIMSFGDFQDMDFSGIRQTPR